MDLERATLKTLFYDYPIEVAMRHIAGLSHATKDNNLLTEFPQVIRWSEKQFSISELRMVEKMLDYEAREVLTTSDLNKANIFHKALCLIPQVAQSWLTHINNYDIAVHYPELFRWRDMTLLMGEDVFTTAFLAHEDIKEIKKERTLFVWDDVIHHDNKILNSVLEQEMTDVHSHYNASIDVFHINWLSLMNTIEDRVRFEFDKGDYQEQSISLHAVEQIFKMRNLCVAAAYLRVWLFTFLMSHDKTSFDWTKFQDVESILKDDMSCVNKMSETQNRIVAMKQDSLFDIHGHSIDYALRIADNEDGNIDTPYLIYQGERLLLYKLFRYVFDSGEDASEIAPYFYLYLLLKNRIRREIIETNQLLGFENFQIYQSRKNLFIEKNNKADNIKRHIPQFIARLNILDNQAIEERIMPWAIRNTRTKHFDKPIFSHETTKDGIAEKITLVAHFFKEDKVPTPSKRKRSRQDKQNSYQTQIYKQASYILQEIEKQKTLDKNNTTLRLVGVDAASSELYCRPERFGHVYRYLKLSGVINRTYHVGEDFFDIVDGLRAIDEAIEFLQLDNNCRIGHALALGTNAEKYYEARHFTTITNKQYMLDCLVWLCQKSFEYNINIKGKIYSFIQNTATRLYNEIGYADAHIFDFTHYWHSMWLRSNEETNNIIQNEWQHSCEYKGKYSKYNKDNSCAKKLFKLYMKSCDVYENGTQTEIFKWPKEIAGVVTQIQDKMIAEIAEKQIAIECNPSSNLKIGHFDRYDEHPIFRFRPIDKNIHTPLLNVSINTDDRGVFATSLYNEFSLIALALTKQRDKDGNRLYNDEAICEYIDHIRQNNLLQRFKV